MAFAKENLIDSCKRVSTNKADAAKILIYFQTARALMCYSALIVHF